MRYPLHRILFAASLVTGTSTLAQMHKVAKPEQVVRAVGVYEWTGDFAKPTASRLIPVSLFIEGKLEDAGIYIARPVPFALLSGNIYELQDAGVDKGILDLEYAKHLQATTSTGDLAYDDGWFGYGSVKPLSAPRKTTTALKPSKTLSVLTSSSSDTSHPHISSKPSGDSTPTASTDQNKQTSTANTSSASTTTTDDPDRPTMKRRSSDTDSTASNSGTTTSTGSTPADDPDRPTMKRHDSSDTANTTSTTSSTPPSTTPDTSSKTSASTTPADDPDRPTMTRRTPTSDTSTTDSGSTTASGSASSDDPDRPTLKRHTPEEAKKAHNNNDLDTVTGNGSLNDDPNRPNLHRGKPTSAMTESDLPKLVGIPSNLHQMVAVSDAVNRDTHPFVLEWDDATQHAAVLQKMQVMAQAQLAAYASTPAKTAPTSKPAVKTTTPTRTTHHTTPSTPPSVPLLDEELKAYTLSYGGAATYIYSAHTAGTGAALRYVTIVAQADGLGELKPAIQSVTDAAHLDRSPQMRFVDVVDAEANNRASLLFELRGQSARQFGLYRVIASHSDQIFVTGTTQ
jgi:hypothetical protein